MRILAVVGCVLAAPALAGPPHLRASTDRSDTGSYTLTWEANGAELALEEATREDFSDARVLYRGTDGASVVSGRLDGRYHYRLVHDGRVRGKVVRVDVVHHGRGEAMAFLGVGALVFLATAVLVLDGHRRHRHASRHDPGIAA